MSARTTSLETPSFHLTIKNDLAELSVVADRVDLFCEELRLGDEIAHAINLAVDELLTNTINYGYDDAEPHPIDVTIVRRQGEVVVTLADDARMFDPTQAGTPDTEAELDDRPIGGLGIHLARAMMDDIDYRHIDGRNQITLTKIIGR